MDADNLKGYAYMNGDDNGTIKEPMPTERIMELLHIIFRAFFKSKKQQAEKEMV